VRWGSALSGEPRLERAVDEIATRLRADLAGARPDLLLVFASAQHARDYERVPVLLAAELEPRVLLGCSAGGVIGAGHEREDEPGLSVTAALLPGVAVAGFHLEPPRTLDADAERWRERMPLHDAPPRFLVLSDPFSADTEGTIQELEAGFAGTRIIGGLASGGRQAGENALWLDATTHRRGLVGVIMAGDVEIDTVVAQGCRPIGEPMFVTACHHNVLRGLDGRPAVTVLQELYRRAERRDQELFRHSLFLGIGMTGGREEYRRGDFLVRNIIDMDASENTLAIGAGLREGQVVQFQLRDAATSAADVEALLAAYARRTPPTRVEGALLFSCVGRGKHLYGRPDLDTDAFRQHLPGVPLGGFFCNGEVGPVHGTTFVHGYTSAFGLFRPRG